jgi:leucyl/phenylalanyl-tRNA--protein transferase
MGGDGEDIQWFNPDPRAVIPLDALHVPKSLQRVARKQPFLFTRDRCFQRVMEACAEPRRYEDETWITPEMIQVYTALHRLGHAHSVEAWTQPAQGEAAELAGGLYGVSLGGAFFGESMFSRATDASKLCLLHLVDHLNARGYRLLDTQMNNPHMAQFGVVEVPRAQYLAQLQQAMALPVSWEG